MPPGVYTVLQLFWGHRAQSCVCSFFRLDCTASLRLQLPPEVLLVPLRQGPPYPLLKHMQRLCFQVKLLSICGHRGRCKGPSGGAVVSVAVWSLRELRLQLVDLLPGELVDAQASTASGHGMWGHVCSVDMPVDGHRGAFYNCCTSPSAVELSQRDQEATPEGATRATHSSPNCMGSIAPGDPAAPSFHHQLLHPPLVPTHHHV